MAKKNVANDSRFIKLLDSVKKFQEDQKDNQEKFYVKRIVMSLGPQMNNPCSGQQCKTGFHPEIFVNPETGDVSCKCVKN